MRLRLKFEHVFLAALIVCVVVSLAAYNLLSNNCDYMAEGISIGAFMRLQDGLPYLSGLDQRPLHLNQYSPLYYLLHAPLLHLLPHTLGVAVVFGRATSLLAGLAALKVAHMLGVAIYGKAFRALPFAICAAFLLLAYPQLWNAVRPDLFSACLELLGVLFLVKSVQSRDFSHRIVSAASCGLAIALKLNQIGAGILAVMVLLFAEGVSAALTFSFVAASTALGAFVIGYLWVGDVMLTNMAVVIQNSRLTPFFFVLGLAKIAQDLLVGLVPLFGAAAFGLSLSLRLDKPQRLTLFLGLPIWFALATVGQLKAGASVNYFHDFCLLLLVPAGWGLSQALDLLQGNPARQRIAWCLGSVVLAITAASAAHRTLYGAVFMRSRNYPYAQAAAFLREHHPKVKIYTDDSSAAVHLHGLTWLGPGHETTLPLTPKLAPTIQHLREELRTSSPVGAVVAVGANCETWTPNGVLSAELSAMTKLEAKFVRVCIFVPADK